MPHLVTLLTLPIALLPFVLGQDSPTCYWPNGESADNRTTPCNTSAEGSHCCGPEDACLSNGYCLQTRGVFANRLGRAACTDPSFPSLYCASFCTDWANFTSTSIFLAYDSEDGKFCCAGYNSSTGLCNFATKDTGGQPFDLPVGRVINDRSTGSIEPNTTESNGNAVQTVTATSTATGSNSSKNTTAVAAGIAVPLSVCLIAALAATSVFWGQNKKLKRQLEEQRQSLLQSQSDHHHQMDGMGYPMSSYKNGQTQYIQPHTELGAEEPLAESDSQPLAEVSGTPLDGSHAKR